MADMAPQSLVLVGADDGTDIGEMGAVQRRMARAVWGVRLSLRGSAGTPGCPSAEWRAELAREVEARQLRVSYHLDDEAVGDLMRHKIDLRVVSEPLRQAAFLQIPLAGQTPGWAPGALAGWLSGLAEVLGGSLGARLSATTALPAPPPVRKNFFWVQDRALAGGAWPGLHGPEGGALTGFRGDVGGPGAAAAASEIANHGRRYWLEVDRDLRDYGGPDAGAPGRFSLALCEQAYRSVYGPDSF